MNATNMPEKKEFTFLHQNDRNIYDMLKIMVNMPMNNVLRYTMFDMLKTYEKKIADIAPDISDEEEDMLLNGNYKQAITSYSQSTNIPYNIAKKVIDSINKNLDKQPD